MFMNKFSKLLLLFIFIPHFVIAGTFDSMFTAVKLDDAKTVVELLRKGGAPDLTDAEGNSLLAVAAREGSERVVKQLLEAGININMPNSRGETALMLAAFHGNLSIASQLLVKGAEPNPVQGWTPLIYAAFQGQIEIAKLNAMTDNGSTALMFAAMGGHEKFVRLLLKSGADASLINQAGKSAIDFALSKSNTDIADLIKRAVDSSIQK
jgi:ankyrin repeat protein